jgi:hypothetical protein
VIKYSVVVAVGSVLLNGINNTLVIINIVILSQLQVSTSTVIFRIHQLLQFNSSFNQSHQTQRYTYLELRHIGQKNYKAEKSAVL